MDDWATLNLNQFFSQHAGLAAGMYSGLTYGLKEARGAYDWVTQMGLNSYDPTLFFEKKIQCSCH